MSKVRIAFVGLGSIGRRHLRNVTAYLEGQNREYDIDVYRTGIGRPIDPDLARKVRRQIPLAEDTPIEEQYDVVFVTNPTSLHFETLERFQNSGKAFFIEKPVFSSTEIDMSRLAGLERKVCYVACPMRYCEVIRYVKERIDLSRVITARAICSSYLPAWRPGTDYRKCYSAHADMGGGVDIDLIHEWDYLLFLFGAAKEGYGITGKISPLEIDSNDIAVYIAKTETTVLELHLDYFGREEMRELLLFLPDDTVRCDFINSRITWLRSGETIELPEERDEFQIREIEHFFDIAEGRVENDSSINHALQALRYAKGDFR